MLCPCHTPAPRTPRRAAYPCVCPQTRAGAQVAAGLPTVVTVAATDDLVAGRAQYLLSTPRFRCYRTTDVQGAPYPNPSVP